MTETLNAALYRDAGVFALERERIFAASWQLLGHENELGEPGAYLAATIAGYPVMAVRGEDGILRAFHNVCRHRAGPLVEDGTGACAGALTCRYHGWRYGLDGRLTSARDFGPAAGFDARQFGLVEIACSTWRGFVFVAMDKAAGPLEAVVAPLQRRAREMDFFEGGRILRSAHEIACNWKTYVENYLEGYHVPIVHPALSASLGNSYRVEIDGFLQFHQAGARPGAAVTGLWGWMWPCLGINLYADAVLMERMWPAGPARTRLEYLYVFRPGAGEDAIARAKAASEVTTREDIAICEAVQRNLDAGIYRTGVLSPRHEQGLVWFQDEIRKVLA
ncbi:MAG TPA: aromatic ring-hydroxylating dioxygenase subunit alpha [Rhizomicrobium sp.]|nr:aromatic ring-hydroxylating dioxygenase subunit alpha [Rhizomicrobium sp.]